MLFLVLMEVKKDWKEWRDQHLLKFEEIIHLQLVLLSLEKQKLLFWRLLTSFMINGMVMRGMMMKRTTKKTLLMMRQGLEQEEKSMAWMLRLKKSWQSLTSWIHSNNSRANIITFNNNSNNNKMPTGGHVSLTLENLLTLPLTMRLTWMDQKEDLFYLQV